MPISKLTLRPGVDLERTPTLNEGGISQGQLVRFFAGMVQKYGGWQALAGVAPLLGTCRGLHGWADFLGNAYLAAGTEQRLSLISGGSTSDLTPLVATDNIAVSFTTTASSASVKITDATTNPAAGDWINLVTYVSVGGIVLQGYYIVDTVVDPTHYTVTATAPASSSVTNGGAVPVYTTTNGSAVVTVTLANHGYVVSDLFNAAVSTTVATVVIFGVYAVASVVDSSHFTITAATTANAGATGSENGGNARIEYLLPTGYAVNTPLTGYGIGDYGAGDWGLSGSSTAIGKLRQWSLDHWGEDLIANPSGGGIYYWAPPNPAPAVVLSGSAPIYNTTAFVMPQVQIIMALGSETGGVQYPTLVRWCDSGDFTDWTPTATNQAGSFQIPTGSALVAGLSVGLGALLWTDVDLWSVTYQGLPFVFGFNRVASNCEALSQRSVAVFGTTVIWPSNRAFFIYESGAVRPIECSVWDFFYETVDFGQVDQIFAAQNSLFNEAAWFFPIGTTSSFYGVTAGDIGYLKINYLEKVWDCGVLARTAWVDHSPVGNPIGADTAGVLQQHEVGTDANGAPMVSNFRTGYFDIADGTEYGFLDLILPDVHAEDPVTLQITLYATDYPGDTPRVYGPYAFNWPGSYLNVRVRGRQIAVQIGSQDLGTFWRLGAFRYRVAQAGRR